MRVFNAVVSMHLTGDRPDKILIKGSAHTQADSITIRDAVSQAVRQSPAAQHGYAFRSRHTDYRTIFGNYRFTVEVTFSTYTPEDFYRHVIRHVYTAAVETFFTYRAATIRVRGYAEASDGK